MLHADFTMGMSSSDVDMDSTGHREPLKPHRPVGLTRLDSPERAGGLAALSAASSRLDPPASASCCSWHSTRRQPPFSKPSRCTLSISHQSSCLGVVGQMLDLQLWHSDDDFTCAVTSNRSRLLDHGQGERYGGSIPRPGRSSISSAISSLTINQVQQSQCLPLALGRLCRVQGLF